MLSSSWSKTTSWVPFHGPFLAGHSVPTSLIDVQEKKQAWRGRVSVVMKFFCCKSSLPSLFPIISLTQSGPSLSPQAVSSVASLSFDLPLCIRFAVASYLSWITTAKLCWTSLNCVFFLYQREDRIQQQQKKEMGCAVGRKLRYLFLVSLESTSFII